MGGRDQIVRVATVSQDGLDRGSADVVPETLERLDAAACNRPDIVCLPEIFAGDIAETVPGPTTERLSQWARDHSCYVVCPIAIRVDECRFNSAVLLDRAGAIVGRYDKIHPTEGEIERGTCPGHTDAPVFRTDFGTIGIQICFDVNNWLGAWGQLKDKGAEIVFWPSAYPAHRLLSALAWINEFYIVSSTMNRASRVYDITGDVIAATGMFQQWADADLNLGKRLFEIDYHTEKIPALQRKYGRRVQVRWYHDEDGFTLASVDPELSMEDLIAEFGLVPLRPYHERCERAQDEARTRCAESHTRGESS